MVFKKNRKRQKINKIETIEAFGSYLVNFDEVGLWILNQLTLPTQI